MKLASPLIDLLLIVLILLVIAVMTHRAHAAECNGTYNGYLQGELPQPPYYADMIDGTLTDFWNNDESAFAIVNGITYRFQNPNLKQIHFDNNNCLFNGFYMADPIFKGAME